MNDCRITNAEIALQTRLLTPGVSSGIHVTPRAETPEQITAREIADAARAAEIERSRAREAAEKAAKLAAEIADIPAFEGRARCLIRDPRLEGILARRRERLYASI